MVTPRSEAYTFDLSGGRLCLDLANTVSDRSSDRPVDHLRTYGDLIAWARQAGTVAPGVARALLAEAAARPEAARHAHVPAASARAHVPVANRTFILKADAAADDLASLLAPVIQSAVELLTSADVTRLRACAADTCEWLFLDTTKNRTRRWCDMNV